MVTAAVPPSLLTRDEAAAYLGIRSNTLAVWVCTKRHVIPFIRVGRCVRYKQADLDRFIEQRTVGACAEAE